MTTSKEEKPFDYLSTQAKLKIEFDNAKTEQEKFIVCVKYASLIDLIEQEAELMPKFLGETGPDKKIKRAVIHLIKWYLDKVKLSPDTTGKDQETALSHAVFCPEVVDLLLSRGANPNLVSFRDLENSFGNDTPLHTIAGYLKYSDIYAKSLLTSVSLLVAAGANPYLKNKKDQIPCNCIANRTEESEDVFSPLELRFMAATEPSFAAEIKEIFPGSSELLSFHEEQPELPLSEEALKDLALYNEGSYQKLLESKPLYQVLKACDSIFESFEFKSSSMSGEGLKNLFELASDSNSRKVDLVGYKHYDPLFKSVPQDSVTHASHPDLTFKSSSMFGAGNSEIGYQGPSLDFKHSF